MYVDARGTYSSETALKEDRMPILRVSGDVVEVLRKSDGQFLRVHVSRRDQHDVILEGKFGEFFTLRSAGDKVSGCLCKRLSPAVGAHALFDLLSHWPSH